MLELLPMNSRTAFTRQYFQKSDQIRNELNIGKDELKANPNIRNFVAATTQKRIWEATPHRKSTLAHDLSELIKTSTVRFHGNFPGRPYPDPRGHCGCRSLSQISAPPPQASPTRSPIIASTTATAASDSSNASPNSSQSQRLTSTPHATGLPAQSLHDAPRLAVNEQSERAYQHLEKPCSNVTPVRTTEAAAGTKHYHPESVSLPQQNKRRRLDNAPAAASARLSKGDGASLTVVPPADDDKQEAERRAIRAKRFGVLQDDSSGKLIDLGFSRATVTVATKATAACCNPPPATIPTSVQTPQEVDLLRSLEDLLDQCQPVTQ
jgi:hypothetical protein